MKALNKKQTAVSLVIGGCIVILSFGAGIFGSIVGNVFFSRNNPLTGQSSVINPTQVVDEQSAIIDVAKSASPAVVSIVISKDLPKYQMYDPYYGFGMPNSGSNQSQTEKQQVGAGSGFIVSKDGLIITNRHVVDDTSASYTVVLNDGTKYDATVVGRDSVLDIAVIKIKVDSDLPFLSLGDSAQIKIGQSVIAIGNSLGEFSNTVSSGIISGLSRSIVAGDQFSGSSETLNGVIQTDASINPGNSGGPLLDISGNVIGVNVAVAQNAENIGFALPIDSVKRVIDSVNKYGEIVTPYIGVRYQIITASIAKQNSLSVDYGAWVLPASQTTKANPSIVKDSPAEKAGLKAGDIILEVNGDQINSTNTLQDEVQKYQVGDTITLKVLRGGDNQTIRLTLEKRPAS